MCNGKSSTDSRFSRRGLLLAALLFLMPGTASAQYAGILVPPGFRVDQYADDDLAHDIHSLTTDAQGRIVVSGPGYVRILIDSDNDGKADSYKTFADGPKSGAQGMYFLGSHLLCSGDDGLVIYRDDNRDDQADGPPQTFLKIKAGGEHHVHSIQKGPDGWWYIIAGNLSEVGSGYATLPTSPIRNPEAGVLIRLKPDLSGGEIVADGFRNAYDFAFTPSGDIFTFDSDGERDISLPWYQPCRVFHVTPGSNAGWVSRSWKRPNNFPDMPQVVAEFGRGSPSGVVCYRHLQFPSRFNGTLFMLDWTFGRIVAVSLEEQQGFWKGQPFIFAKSTGQFGFAPTDLEVGPDGSLFVSVGGRGSRGSVFRIVNIENEKRDLYPAQPGPGEAEQLKYVLTAPQPESSWSRARWTPVAKQLGKAVFSAAAVDEGRPPIERVRAIEVLTETFDGLDAPTARILTAAHSVPVRARAAWSIGRTNPEAPSESAMTSFLTDREPLVARFALESLTTVQNKLLLDHCLPRVAVTLGSTDAAVRSASAHLMAHFTADQQKQLASLLEPSPRAQLWMAMGQMERTSSLSLPAAKIALRTLQDASATSEHKFDALRLLQLSLGDVGPRKGLPEVFESYVARGDLKSNDFQLNPVRTFLADTFPTGDAQYDHELIRTISMLGSVNRRLIGRLLEGITETSLPADDIHRLAALSRVEASRTEQESLATAKAMVDLDLKIKRMSLKQDANWDDRVSELLKAICTTDGQVASLVTSQPGFGLPGHVLFLKQIPADYRPQAIDGFARTISADESYAWNSDIVRIIGESEAPEHQQLVRSQIDNLSVQDAVLVVMSRQPKQEDRKIYLNGLNSTQLSTNEACLNAMLSLPRSNDAAEQFTLLATARRLSHDETEFKLRESVMRLLENNMVQSFGFVYGEDGFRQQPEALARWETYLKDRFPGYKPPIDGGDAAQRVLSVLHEVRWETGNVARGQQLFAKYSCAKCHGGRTALGPDLQGVTRRFSREDLFASIVDPNRDVSARYQTTTVETKGGRAYTGVVVYESVDGVLLRDSEHQTYRIEAHDIETKVNRRVSLMPNGLLRNVGDQDLADLNAYLQTL